MGYRSVTGKSPLSAALAMVKDPKADRPRRREAHRRIDLLQDNAEAQIREEMSRLLSPGRRQRLLPYARLAQAKSLFKRLITEIARAVYAVAPTRTVINPHVVRTEGIPEDPQDPVEPDPVAIQDQKAFDELAKRGRLNRKYALACRILRATNAVFIHFRISERLGFLCDVISPHQIIVLPDPDDPTRELGLAYQKNWLDETGAEKCSWVYWDDEEAFEFTEDGRLLDIMGVDGKKAPRLTKANGHPGILPFVAIHLFERFGTYWIVTEGNDLVYADKSQKFVYASRLRLLKTQGHQQLALVGDLSGVAAGQELDEENPIRIQTPLGGASADAKVLAQPTDTANHEAAEDHIGLTAAATVGVNREQMNHQQTKGTDQTGLQERRAEFIELFAEAEQRAFEILKVLSASTDFPISSEAILDVDFAEVSRTVDRADQLAIWQTELLLGLKNYYDLVRADNPEITTDEEAEEELQKNSLINTRWKDRFRRMNMPLTASIQDNGQTPEQNGAAGGKQAAANANADDLGELGD